MISLNMDSYGLPAQVEASFTHLRKTYEDTRSTAELVAVAYFAISGEDMVSSYRMSDTKLSIVSTYRPTLELLFAAQEFHMFTRVTGQRGLAVTSPLPHAEQQFAIPLTETRMKSDPREVGSAIFNWIH